MSHKCYDFELANALLNVNKNRDEMLFWWNFLDYFDLLDIKESFLLNFILREQDKGTRFLSAC